MTAILADARATRHVCAGQIAGSDKPACEFFALGRHAVPVLIAVPHAGRAYPQALLSNLKEPAIAMLRLEDRLVDLVAREAAQLSGAGLLVANAPRAMLDLNRAPDDVDWGMISDAKPPPARHSQANRRARSGLGLIPRRLADLGEIWKSPLSQAELDERIEHIHGPYHTLLSHELERIRDQWGAALLLDFHSMPPLGQRHHDLDHAQFVIGDRHGASCDLALSQLALRYLEGHGRAASHNRPYSGGFALERHAAPRRGIDAMQIEICRTTYLDSRLAEPSARLPQVARLLAGLVSELGQETARRAQRRYPAQAAE